MSIRRDLEQIAELAPRVAIYFTAKDPAGQTAWDRINLAMTGHPKAAQWDLERVSGTPWCWTHQQDLRDCHEAAWGCLADDQISGPSDPTGEAGMQGAMWGDRAADIERQCYDDVKALLRILQRLEDNGSKFPPTRDASQYERELTAGNEPQCESCARFRDDRKKPYWSPPMLNGSDQPYRTTRGDALTEPMYLCRGCDTHVAMRGCLPNEQEIRAVHDHGKQLMRVCRHPEKAETTEDAA